MFKFLKDMWWMSKGVDLETVDLERVKNERKSKDHTSAVILVFGLLYFVVAAFGITFAAKTGNGVSIFKYVFLTLLDTASLITYFTGHKKIAWVGIIAFVVIGMITSPIW
jgi:hypothetical protein